jgi:hypothetical protein
MSANLVPVDDAPANSGGSAFGRPFPKGTSGNPTGRPKGMAALSQRIRRETKEGKVIVDVLLDRMLHGRGDRSRIEAAALLLAYAYGKPTQPLEHSGPDGGPIELSDADLERKFTQDLARIAALAGAAGVLSSSDASAEEGAGLAVVGVDGA